MFSSSKDKFRVELLSIFSDLIALNHAERSDLNRLRSKDDSDCGICEQLILLRGREEGILSVVAVLNERHLL